MKTKDYILLIIAFAFFWAVTNKRANDYFFGEEVTISSSDTTFHKPDIITVNFPTPREQSISASDIRMIIEEARMKNDYDLVKENKYLKEHLAYIKANPDSLRGDVKVYKDSSVNPDINIYYSALTRGELLDINFNYKQKGIKSISNKSKTFSNLGKLYLTGSAGGNTSTFNDLSPGLFYSSKGRIGIGYEFNLWDKTHRAKLGIKIFEHR